MVRFCFWCTNTTRSPIKTYSNKKKKSFRLFVGCYKCDLIKILSVFRLKLNKFDSVFSFNYFFSSIFCQSSVSFSNGRLFICFHPLAVIQPYVRDLTNLYSHLTLGPWWQHWHSAFGNLYSFSQLNWLFIRFVFGTVWTTINLAWKMRGCRLVDLRMDFTMR